jgi:hypothetical protein
MMHDREKSDSAIVATAAPINNPGMSAASTIAAHTATAPGVGNGFR